MAAKLTELLKEFKKDFGVSKVQELKEMLAEVRDSDPDSITALEQVEDDEIAKLKKLALNGDQPEAGTDSAGAAKEEAQTESTQKRRSGRRFKRSRGDSPTKKEAEDDSGEKELIEEDEDDSDGKKSQRRARRLRRRPSQKKKDETQEEDTSEESGDTDSDTSDDQVETTEVEAEAELAEAEETEEKDSDDSSTDDSDEDGKKRGRRVRRRLDRKSGKKKSDSKTKTEDDDSGSRKRIFNVKGIKTPGQKKKEVSRFLKITGEMSVRELSESIGVGSQKILKFLRRDLGTQADMDSLIDPDQVALVCEDFDIDYELAISSEAEELLEEFEQVEEEDLEPRPPVITVMGHVDHGKTLLLDTIRKTSVAEREAGGITQHIGAYQVEHDDSPITFIDTPGHEAFTQMRARGSEVTDIVVLVVAADDGVMPQTVEAIEHARAAGVPIVVAVNKMDLEEADPDRVLAELSDHEVIPEDWGGDTPCVEVSALTGDGIDNLLEMISITAELEDLKGDPEANPYGTVLEAEMDQHLGVLTTVLVQQGTFRKKGYVAAGTTYGRIRRIENFKGDQIEEAGPSSPIRVVGLDEMPESGDTCYFFEDRDRAESVVEERKDAERRQMQEDSTGISLEKLKQQLEAGQVEELKIVLKTDVQGSIAAVEQALKDIEVEGTDVEIIRSGVGDISKNDLNLAAASDAVILGFNVDVSSAVTREADREGVDVRTYDVIYEMVEDIERALTGLLEPEYREEELGRLEVRAIFLTTDNSVIAGGYVLDGTVKRGAKYRLTREGDLIHESTLSSLKRYEDDVNEVSSGYECGVRIEGTDDVQEGDILEFYEEVEIDPLGEDSAE